MNLGPSFSPILGSKSSCFFNIGSKKGRESSRAKKCRLFPASFLLGFFRPQNGKWFYSEKMSFLLFCFLSNNSGKMARFVDNEFWFPKDN